MRNSIVPSCVMVGIICFVVTSSLWATGFPPKIPQYPLGGMGLPITGDFNGDGKLDLLVLSPCNPEPCSTPSIAVTLGYGDGHFQRPILSGTTPASFGYSGLPVAGDFNRDHKLDLGFIGFTSSQPRANAIAVALGNGDGTFGAISFNPTTSLGETLWAGDVNGDSDLDLVTLTGRQVQVFLGSGDGTFREQAPGTYAGYSECVLADVNHDGKPDLIGTYLQLGNGDGTFQEAQQIYGVGNCPAVADFNGDGNLDVAVQVRNGISPSYYSQNGVNLYFGNGDGSFQAPVFRWMGGDGYWYLSAGDFNGDGRPDLITVRGHAIAISLNTGNATFRPPVGYVQLGWPVLAEINGDGKTDVIFVSLGDQSSKSLVLPAIAGSGGTFSLIRSYFVSGGGSAASIIAGDFDGDGKSDLIELNFDSGTWLGGHLNRLLGNGDGTFRSMNDLPSGGKSSYAEVSCDLNHDGKLDVIVASGDSLNVRLGLGNGTFQSPTSYPFYPQYSGSPGAIALADFNGDGNPDVVVNGGPWAPGVLFFGNGDGTFRSGAPVPAKFNWVIAGDFNGDGKQDLAIATSTPRGYSAVGILSGNGDGTFQPFSGLRIGQAESLLAADFNLDGKLDVAAVGTTAGGNAVLSIYPGNGDGSLQLAHNVWIHGGVSPRGVVAADFNGDGKIDIAVSLTSYEVALLLADGTGRFQSPTFYFGGGGPLVAADLDGNGTEDLAVATSGETAAILLNK